MKTRSPSFHITGGSQGAATAALLVVFAAVPALAADRWWDGGTTNIDTIGDGVSAGVVGNWSTSTQNWDQGSGQAHVAWDNGGNDTAIFGQITSGTTITLVTDISVNSLRNISTASTYTFSGAGRTLTLSGTAPNIFAGSTTQINTAIAGSNGLIKNGPGSLTIQSSATNSSFTGGLSVNQGILELNFANFSGATVADVVNSNNTLNLDSGSALRIRGKSGTNASQTLGAVTLNGASAINVNGAASVTTSLSLGTIDRGTGATLNFSATTTGTNAINVQSGTNLGNWAVTSASGLGISAPLFYATVNGSNQVVTRVGTAAADAAALGGDTSGNANYDLALASGTVPGTVNANSIRYTGGAATTTLGASSFTVKSLMNGGQGGTSGLWTISGGGLNIGGQELIVHSGEKGIAINSAIKESVVGSGVTINAAINGTNGGAVTLGGANEYTGDTIINGNNAFASGGHLIVNTFKNIKAAPTDLVGQSSTFGAGLTSKVILNGATLRSAPTSAQATDRNMTWLGNSGFYNAGGNVNVTFSGNISGSGTFNIDQNNSGSGRLVLSGDNDYSGEIQFQTDGRLTISGAKALKLATLNVNAQRADIAFSGNHAFEIGSLKGGSVGLDFGASNTSVVTIGANGQTNTFTGPLTGGVSLTKAGAGTQTLVTAAYAGKTTIQDGTLKLQSMQGLASTTLTLSNDGSAGTPWTNKKYITVTPAQAATFAVGQTVYVNGGAADQITHIDYTGKLYLRDSNVIGSATVSIDAMSGSIASSTIEVQDGAYLDVSGVTGFSLGSTQTLSGSGTVTGTMTVAGTLSPGSSPGTLSTGSQIWTTGGDYNFQVYDATGAAGTGYDTVAITGTLDLSGLADGGFSINLWSLAGIAPDANGDALNFNAGSNYSWVLASASGGISGFEVGDFLINTGANNGTNGFTNPTDGGAFSVSSDGNNLVLNFAAAAVPEPSVLLLGSFGLLALARRRR